MDLTLHQLRIFLTVAERLSFSRAADDLLLTQPAVSMQVKRLERVVGMRLFDHVGRHIQLTEAGRDLYTRARVVAGLVDEMATAMSDMRAGRRGPLRVIATTTVGIYVVPNLLRVYHQRRPEVDIKLEVANWERTCERLFTGQADVAIAGPHPEPELEMEPFMYDELVVIASPDHSLAGRSQIELKEIAAQPMMLREPGSGTRGAVERLFADQQVPLRRAMELSRIGAVKQVVRAGLGVAVISRAALSLELEMGHLCVLDVVGFPIVRSWNVITRRGVTLSPAANAFCEELRGQTLNP